MASQESGQADKSNAEPVLEERADGQVTASHAPSGSGTDANGSVNTSVPGVCDEAMSATRGSSPAKKPSDEPRGGESPSSKTQTHEKSTISKHAHSKRKSSSASLGRHAGGERRGSRISASSKAGVRALGSVSAHKVPSSPTLSTSALKSDGAVNSGERSRPARYCSAATQNQLTPELFPGSPETMPQSDGTPHQQGLERGQPVASSSSGQEAVHHGESGEALPKGEGKEEGEAVAGEAKEKVEEKEGEEKTKEEEKKPAEKKARKKASRGFKMPDGTYVGLKEKNRYLRAMHKEHLKCDYVPFCILGVLAVIVITLVYLYAYRPDIFNRFIEAIRSLLGLNKREEENKEAGLFDDVIQNSRTLAAPASPPTLQYPPLASTPAYGGIPPRPVLPQDGLVGSPPLLPMPYHYAMAPCVGAWPPPAPYLAPIQYPVSRRSYSLSPQPLSALSPGDYEPKRVPAELTRNTGATSRRQSAQRRDTPLMLQRCGPFYAWQLIIMWLAVLGTVVFVCSFAAFRTYLTQEPPVDGLARARESALTSTPGQRNRLQHKSAFSAAVYVNASCGIHHPCRGVGLLCIGGQCTCGPDFEEQGKLCAPKRNVAVDISIAAQTPLPHRRRESSKANRPKPDPRKGVVGRNFLNKEVTHTRATAVEEEFTFVLATFEYEDHAQRHIVDEEGTGTKGTEAANLPSWQRHADYN